MPLPPLQPTRAPRHHRRKPVVATSPPPPPPGPRVALADVDEANGWIDVVFDQAVTWDGGHGTFVTSTGSGSWGTQVDAVTIRLYPDCGVIFEEGATWSWESPDGSLTPTPDPTQTGICS